MPWIETGKRIWQYDLGGRRFNGIVWGDVDPPRFSMPGGYSWSDSSGRSGECDCGERSTIEECKREVEQRQAR